jgi:uncharacterized membrane protein (DUF485 family)
MTNNTGTEPVDHIASLLSLGTFVFCVFSVICFLAVTLTPRHDDGMYKWWLSLAVFGMTMAFILTAVYMERDDNGTNGLPVMSRHAENISPDTVTWCP